MITIKKMKEELNKFPDDATCYAYEGEAIGLIIEKEGLDDQGVIFCSESDRVEKDTITLD